MARAREGSPAGAGAEITSYNDVLSLRDRNDREATKSRGARPLLRSTCYWDSGPTRETVAKYNAKQFGLSCGKKLLSWRAVGGERRSEMKPAWWLMVMILAPSLALAQAAGSAKTTPKAAAPAKSGTATAAKPANPLASAATEQQVAFEEVHYRDAAVSGNAKFMEKV